VDALLALRLPGAPTRGRVQRALKDGGVLLNGVPVAKVSMKVRVGDRVEWLRDAIRAAPGLVEPEEIPFHIYHEDAACIVLEKPAGMCVHPAGGIRSGTLVNALLFHVGYKKPLDSSLPPLNCCESDSDNCSESDFGGDQEASCTDWIEEPVAVRGTSGVMVVAKQDAAHSALAAQFAARTSKRTYLALVWGVPEPREGTVVGAIGRDPGDRLRMTVVAEGKGKHAVTHYSVVEALDGGHASMVRFRLETGRTHQVRVHSRHLGHPLLGDSTYGGAQLLRGPRSPERVALYEGQLFAKGSILNDETPGSCSGQKATASLLRPALHAESLGFAHPFTGHSMSFGSKLAEDMELSAALLRDLMSPAEGVEGQKGSRR
ncbi:unnamed protein product, partial [Polarella glacialis]